MLFYKRLKFQNQSPGAFLKNNHLVKILQSSIDIVDRAFYSQTFCSLQLKSFQTTVSLLQLLNTLENLRWNRLDTEGQLVFKVFTTTVVFLEF